MNLQKNIQNIWAIGRNYADHAKELGNSIPQEPLIFLKSGATILTSGQSLSLPPHSQNVHHEVEMAIQLGEDLQPANVAIALDLTARDLQEELKKKAHPWTLAKSFIHSTPLGTFTSIKNCRDLSKLRLQLLVNGEIRQQGSTSQMIFSTESILEYLKPRVPLCPGDLLLTGTPQGVGAIQKDDELRAQLLDENGKILSEGLWTVQRN